MNLAAVGVIINPVAGIGGRAAQHGSDGQAAVRARELGGVCAAPRRMSDALRALGEALPGVRLLTASGEMGSTVASELGLEFDEVVVSDGVTSASDTRTAATLMRDRGAGLILFAGGDGTARDVFAAVGTTVPILGVPAGVKMHSAVFAVNPRAAGAAAAAYLGDGDRSSTVSAEIADLAPSAFSSVSDENPRTIAIFGIAQVPRQPTRMQTMKSGSISAEGQDLAALGQEIAAEMLLDRLYLLGPGTTVAHVKTALGIQGAVLGFDVVRNGELICRDATEQQLYDLVSHSPHTTLVLGVIGGQGFLLGRGNQQISGRILSAVGEANVEILAAQEKLSLLNPPVLRVDLDDDAEQARLTGYRRVRTRPRHSTVLKVVN